eukprot:12097163-Alexandrium_andersonii.AAC.1
MCIRDRACAPSFGAASTAPGRLRRVGRRCKPRRWRASGSPEGKRAPVVFHNAELDVRCVVHGDDFTFARYDADLGVVEKVMGDKFFCKVEGALAAVRRTYGRWSC